MSMYEENNSGRDRLSLGARIGEIIGLVCLFLLLVFFVSHQTMNTGFFTDKFGTLEMLCLYVPLLLGFSAPAVRALTGRRNPARPFEALTSLVLALGSLVLLIVFPLNYAHLPDVLPSGLQFLLAWVTDGIAKFVLLIQVVIGPISALLTMWRYFSSRQEDVDASFRRRAL